VMWDAHGHPYSRVEDMAICGPAVVRKTTSHLTVH
jgi:hypothetical protein